MPSPGFVGRVARGEQHIPGTTSTKTHAGATVGCGCGAFRPERERSSACRRSEPERERGAFTPRSATANRPRAPGRWGECGTPTGSSSRYNAGMGHRSKARRVLKWVGLLLCTAILAVTVVGSWWPFLWKVTTREWGDFETGVGGPHSQPLRTVVSFRHRPKNVPPLERWGDDTLWPARRHDLPLWVPFVVVAVPTAVLWWLDLRRIPPGHCQKCGYNLSGNISGRCPECGGPT
jgi:hypothetical protein